MAQAERRQLAAADACLSMAAWLRLRGGVGLDDARRRVKRAHLLRRVPHLDKALAGGRVTVAHVDAAMRHLTDSRLRYVSPPTRPSPMSRPSPTRARWRRW